MNVAATIDRTQREYSQAAKDFLARKPQLSSSTANGSIHRMTR